MRTAIVHDADADPFLGDRILDSLRNIWPDARAYVVRRSGEAGSWIADLRLPWSRRILPVAPTTASSTQSLPVCGSGRSWSARHCNSAPTRSTRNPRSRSAGRRGKPKRTGPSPSTENPSRTWQSTMVSADIQGAVSRIAAGEPQKDQGGDCGVALAPQDLDLSSCSTREWDMPSTSPASR